jgi:hypothetical protein
MNVEMGDHRALRLAAMTVIAVLVIACARRRRVRWMTT